MRRLIAGVFGIALCATGCTSADEVTWDLTDPVTGPDLGSMSPQLADVEGPGPITVRFPSGRVVEFEGFRYAAVVLDDNQLNNFLDQVVILSSRTPDAEEIEEIVENFDDEWGTAINEEGLTLEAFADLVSDGDGSVDRGVFVGQLQDGVTPMFESSVDRGPSVAVLLDFDP